MTKIILTTMVLVFTQALTQMAFAQSKVGIVDMQKAVQATASGKKAKENLDGEFKKRKEGLDKKKSDIDKMGSDLEKKKSVLSEEVFNKKQMELQEEMMKFQKVVAENQVEIQKKERELVEPILEKMRKVIAKVALEKGFNLIFERQGPNILFATADVDVTDDVIKSFEKEK
jgi:outer membrane protein